MIGEDKVHGIAGFKHIPRLIGCGSLDDYHPCLTECVCYYEPNNRFVFHDENARGSAFFRIDFQLHPPRLSP